MISVVSVQTFNDALMHPLPSISLAVCFINFMIAFAAKGLRSSKRRSWIFVSINQFYVVVNDVGKDILYVFRFCHYWTCQFPLNFKCRKIIDFCKYFDCVFINETVTDEGLLVLLMMTNCQGIWNCARISFLSYLNLHAHLSEVWKSLLLLLL